MNNAFRSACRPASRSARGSLLLALALGVAACASDALKQAPASPDKPWAPEGATATPGDFAVAANAEVGRVSPGIRSGTTYGLPALIDLAQRSHPSTRLAWEQARQAALAVGMVEATFLPVITANVIAGRQDVVTPLPTLDGRTTYVSTTASGVAPNLALQWLVFDFGQRQAWRDAAKQNAYAANVTFNGTHQALIYNVTRAYYQYGAATSDLAIARQALANSRSVQDAAEARYAQGTGTTIETAQARQLVAQSNLRLVQAQDQERDSYQELLGAIGISPRSEIRVAPSGDRALPRASALPTDALIEAALARRPDVLASYAAVKAGEAGERAADAGYMPKVYVSGVAGTNNTSLQTGGLSGIDGQSTASGVLLGVTIPLYEGGLRDATRRQARSVTAAAAATLEQTQNAAMSEIILAANTLRSSLEAYAAASALTDAAQVTYDAASDAYRNGVGTITDATAADTGLLDARQAKADAHAAALIAASTLAFSLGRMTSATSPVEANTR